MSEAVGILVELLVEDVMVRLWLEKELEKLIQSSFALERDFHSKKDAFLCQREHGKLLDRNLCLKEEDGLGHSSEFGYDPDKVDASSTLPTASEIRTENETSTSEFREEGILGSNIRKNVRTNSLLQVNWRSGVEDFPIFSYSGLGHDETNAVQERTDQDDTNSLWSTGLHQFLQTLKMAGEDEDDEAVRRWLKGVVDDLAAKGDGDRLHGGLEIELVQLSIEEVLLRLKEEDIDTVPLINIFYKHMTLM